MRGYPEAELEKAELGFSFQDGTGFYRATMTLTLEAR